MRRLAGRLARLGGRARGAAVGRLMAMGLVAAVLPGAAAAQERGIQLSLDGTRVLVNKTIGADQWGITLNTESRTITGNVFPGDGGDPIFIFCEPDLVLSDTWRCLGAERCMTATCIDQYVDFGGITLPPAFFAPPGFGPEAAASVRAAARVTSAAATSGFQETPDGMHVLVSKDVNGQRWAITLNRDDRTLTGNVFFPDGRPPAFVSCGQDFGNHNAFRCSGAGPCETDGCMDQYELIGTVTLAQDFFGPQTCGNFRVESSERCEADTFCFVLCGIDALCQGDPEPLPGVCADDCTLCEPISN